MSTLVDEPTTDHPLTRIFRHLHETHRGRDVTVAEIREALGPEGTPAFIILLALPFCLPITIPGLSIPFGLSIAYLSHRMLNGMPTQLPKKICDHSISAKNFDRLMTFTIRWWTRIERVVHQRFDAVGAAPWLQKVSGWLIMMNGLVLCLPAPIPLSNTLPAAAIVALSLGAVEQDGLFSVVGMFLSLLGVTYIALILIVGKLALLRFFGVV